MLVGRLTAEPEATSRFDGLDNTEVVTLIYKSLFNRAPDTDGLAFFVDQLKNGNQTIEIIAINILDGAKGSDKTIIENKITAANAFTQALDTTEEIKAYVGDNAADVGRDFLKDITDDKSTIPTAEQTQSAINPLVTPTVSPTPTIDPTITFTAAGANSVTPTNTLNNNAARTVDDTINSTDAFLNGSTVDGLGATDTLNVTDAATAANFNTATIQNTEIINLAAGTTGAIDTNSIDANLTTINATTTSSVTIDADNAGITFNGSTGNDTLTIGTVDFTGTFAGGDGTDELSSAGSNISTATISAETLTLTAGTTTMTAAQHAAFTTITAGGSAITFTDAFTGTGNATVGGYTLAAAGGSNITLGSVTQNLAHAGGVNTVNFGGLTSTGSLVGFDADDTAVVTTGGNISAVNGGLALGTGILNLTGTATISVVQHAAFTSINGTSGSDQINIANGNFGTITTNATVEAYSIGEDTSDNSFAVVVEGAAQTVTSTNAADEVSFSLGTPTSFTGTLTGASANDTLTLDNNDNVSGGTLTGVENLTVTGSNTTTTYNNTQINAFTGVTATGINNTAVITDTATITLDDAGALQRGDFDNFTFNTQANVTVQMETGDTKINTVTLENGGAGGDLVTINNDDTTATANDYVIINNYNQGADDIRLEFGGVAVAGGFTGLDATGNTNMGQAIDDIIVEAVGVADQVTAATSTDVADGGAVELAILNIYDTHAGTNPNNKAIFILYGSGNAYLYAYEETSNVGGGAVLVQGDFEVELIGVVNGIANGDFNSPDFN